MSGLDDDELDAELSRLFGDERLDVQPKCDAPQTIVAGVQRIRRRRAVLTAAGGVTVAAALVAGGLTFGPFRAQNGAAALSTNALATGASSQVTSGPSTSAPSTAPTSTVVVAPPTPTASLPGVGGETPPKKPAKSPTSSPRPSTNFVTAGPELRADGFGKLKLGMTEVEASAQGITLQKTRVSDQCVFYGISGNGVPASGSVAISNTYGLVIIEPSTPAHTPEGVGKGSSKDDVLQKYSETVSNAAATSASAGPESTYRFDVDTANVVQAVALYSVKQDCAG